MVGYFLVMRFRNLRKCAHCGTGWTDNTWQNLKKGLLTSCLVLTQMYQTYGASSSKITQWVRFARTQTPAPFWGMSATQFHVTHARAHTHTCPPSSDRVRQGYKSSKRKAFLWDLALLFSLFDKRKRVISLHVNRWNQKKWCHWISWTGMKGP